MTAGALRVLVVEDSVFGREVLCSLLKQQGHEVLPVGTGAEAIEAATTMDHDVVLLDIELPDTDGASVARAIRSEKPGLPILAVTGHSAEGYDDTDMDGVLTKPVRPDALFAAIERAIGRRIRSTTLAKLGGSPKLLAKVVAAFRDETPRLLDEIRAAIDAGDAQSLHRLAHTVLGSVRYFDAPHAAAAALRLQEMGQTDDLEDARAVTERLAEACAQLTSSLAATGPEA